MLRSVTQWTKEQIVHIDMSEGWTLQKLQTDAVNEFEEYLSSFVKKKVYEAVLNHRGWLDNKFITGD